MRRRFMQFMAAALALCLTVPAGGAVGTNRDGDLMIRVGLASADSHVPTGELEAAHLENNDGCGAGYRFGYYDSERNFVELGRTGSGVTRVAVLKTENLYYGKSAALNKYTYSASISSSVMVGCVHIRMPGTYRTFEEAAAAAKQFEDGFVAWIDGQYQVRVGAYGTGAEARAVQAELGGIGEVLGTSAYGMSVVETGTDRVLFQYDNGSSGALAVLPDVTGAGEVQTWCLGYKYRGGFQYFRRSGGNLSVVNMVELEDYVNGVACYEMGRDWPLEALKTQAVCARTYVLKNLGKHSSSGFDICTSTGCQVYHGMGSERADYGPSQTSMQAVVETAGMVVKYQGRLAEVPYSSSFGGASEDAKNVWGSDTVNEFPYLKGVVDPYEADLNDRNPQSPWTVTYTSDQLTKQLQKNGMGTGTSVKSLDLIYSELGNVIRVVVHWANGQSNTISASNIRSRLGVKAIRFTVNGAGTGTGSAPAAPPAGNPGDILLNGSGTLDSLEGIYTLSGSGTTAPADGECYIITGTGDVSKLDAGGNSGGGTSPVQPVQPGSGTVTVSGSTYTFNGGGYGHQIGMSQFGANAMARRGFGFEEIVTFYFPGVQVVHY